MKLGQDPTAEQRSLITTKKYYLTCSQCKNTFKSYFTFLTHEGNCLQKLAIMNCTIINRKSEFTNFTESLEIENCVSLNAIKMPAGKIYCIATIGKELNSIALSY